MSIGRIIGIAAAALVLAGCSGAEIKQVLLGTARGTAESACRAASNCSTGIRRDPLAPKPAWDRGGAVPNDNPFRLPPK